MALTRAQLLAGNKDLGTVLPGQVQAVTAGSGVQINNQGVLSLNASDNTFNGFIKTNASNAYNAYVWPTGDGLAGQFLQTDSNGNLMWADPSGYAVVTVDDNAPTPPDVGELWFDCTTGSLKVYQDCVPSGGPANWFNVGQPGLPVLAVNTDATPDFVGGTGTAADPFVCDPVTVASNTSAYVTNVVQITGLAPFQYVPIIDQNAIANGGRFEFTNNYANASGVLQFEIVFVDLPASTPTNTYQADIRVGYGTIYIQADINIVDPLTVAPGTISGNSNVGSLLTFTPGAVSGGIPPYQAATYQWKANGTNISGATSTTYTTVSGDLGKTITVTQTVKDSQLPVAATASSTSGGIVIGPPVTITDPGVISGSAQVDAVLSYSGATASGGTGSYTYTWLWKKVSDNSTLQTNGSTYPIPAGMLGQQIYITVTAQDTAGATASGNTAIFPTPPATIQPSGVTNSSAPTTIPGTSSFTWANGNANLTATGCLEFSVNGGLSFTQLSTPVSNGTNVITQWSTSSGCGGQVSGTINGCLVSSTGPQSCFSLTIDRVPDPFVLNPSTESTTPLTTTTSNPSASFVGKTAPPLLWGSVTGGSLPQYSVNNGGTWFSLPSSPTTGVEAPLSPVVFRFLTGSSEGTSVLTVNAGASTAPNDFQAALFTVSVNTVPFTSSFTPSSGPTASPASVNIPGQSLYGTATCSSWADGFATLTATGSLQFQVNGGGFGIGPTNVNNGNTVDVIWNPSAVSSAADGATLLGSLTNGPKANEYSLFVDRSPSSISGLFTDQIDQPFLTQITSNTVTPSGFNVPVTLTVSSGSPNSLTSIASRVGTGAYSSAAKTVNPGDAIQIQGTTGSGLNTDYTMGVSLGSGPAVTDTWLVNTVDTPPTVTTPSISTPGQGSTGQGTAAGITITSSGYSASGGAGTHATSDWELYSGGFPLTSTNKVTGVTSTNGLLNWATRAVGFETGHLACAAGSKASNAFVVGVQITSNGDYVNDYLYSSDGVTWTGTGTKVAGAAKEITWNVAGGVFGAVQNFSFQLGNSTGSSWGSPVTIPQAGGNSVAGNGNTWVIASSSSTFGYTLRYSTDNGSTFTSTSLAGFSVGTRVAYANGRFVIAGYGPSSKGMYYSTNGTSWTAATIPAAAAGPTGRQFSGLAYGSGRWIASGGVGPLSTGTFLTSTDNGVTWSEFTPTVSGSPISNVWNMAFGNGQFVIIPGQLLGGQFWYSNDGFNWTFSNAGDWGNGEVEVRGLGSNASGRWVFCGGNFASITPTPAKLTSTTSSSSTDITIAGAQTDGFLAGMTVKSSPAGAGPATILSLTDSSISLSLSSGWLANSTQNLVTDSSSYSLTSQLTGSSVSLTSWTVPKPPLTANTTFYARVRYTSNAVVTTSNWSPFRQFTTGGL